MRNGTSNELQESAPTGDARSSATSVSPAALPARPGEVRPRPAKPVLSGLACLVSAFPARSFAQGALASDRYSVDFFRRDSAHSAAALRQRLGEALWRASAHRALTTVDAAHSKVAR